MNRRNFLIGSTGAAGASVALALPPQAVSANGDIEGPIRKGYRLLWTGWKGRPDSITLAGQWVAISERYGQRREEVNSGYRLTYCHAYADVGGSVGWFCDGERLDTIRNHPIKIISIYSTEEDKREAQKRALSLLLIFIDADGNPDPTCAYCLETCYAGELTEERHTSVPWYYNNHSACFLKYHG